MTRVARAKLAADLDELRLLAGLTYRELASRTGCARSTLHDALTGRRFPRLDTVLAIVRSCGGDAANWRKRWVAGKRASATHGMLDLITQEVGQEPGTAPRTSRQSTRPS